MPTISMFYGIIISMFFEIKEKHHLPHIHVRYQSFRASVDIDGATLLAGDLPPRQLRMVQVWIDLHREELLADGELAREGVEPFRIDPLTGHWGQHAFGVWVKKLSSRASPHAPPPPSA